MTVVNDKLEKGLAQPLLLPPSKNGRDEEDDQECDESEEASVESLLPASSLASAYRLLTPSIKVWLFFLVGNNYNYKLNNKNRDFLIKGHSSHICLKNTSLLPMDWSFYYLIHNLLLHFRQL